MQARSRWCVLALAIGAVALATTPAPPALADHELWPETGILPCTLPAHELAADRPGADDTPATIDLLVLIDRVPDAFDVEAIIDTAAVAYQEIGLPVSATFEHREFVGQDTTSLMKQLRESIVGTGAERYDAVLLETGVDITNPTGTNIAGYANCLGGVRFRDQLQSYAVAEVGYGARSMPGASADAQLQSDALIAAHEVGHLFGARHEHGKCAEHLDLAGAAAGHRQRPCTIMGEMMSLGASGFGVLEAAVIRGHARHYAQP